MTWVGIDGYYLKSELRVRSAVRADHRQRCAASPTSRSSSPRPVRRPSADQPAKIANLFAGHPRLRAAGVHLVRLHRHRGLPDQPTTRRRWPRSSRGPRPISGRDHDRWPAPHRAGHRVSGHYARRVPGQPGFEVLGVDTARGGWLSSAPGGCPSTSRGWVTCCAPGWTAGGCGSPPPTRRWRRSATCTSSAQAPRRSRAATTPTCRRCSPASGTLAPLLARPCLIAGKSTVPVGHRPAAGRRPRGRGHRRRAGLEPGVPARGLGGRGHPRAGPDRSRGDLPAGRGSPAPGLLPAARGRARRFFATDLETAELAKVAANSFLATQDLVHQRHGARCARQLAAMSASLADILGADSRIGPAFLRPGLGFGGGCLPKDIRAFIAWAGRSLPGEALGFLREVDAINLRRRARTADLAAELAGGTWPGSRSACSARPSSPAPTTSGTPRRWTWRRSCTAWAHRSPCTTRSRWTTPGGLPGTALRGQRAAGRPGRAGRAGAHRMERVRRPRPR